MRALITGITGQDGSYLAELLLAQGYHVSGTVRKNSPTSNIEHLRSQIALLETDLLDRDSVMSAVRQAAPDEVYHLAAKTFVPSSHEDPQSVIEFAERSVGNLLAALKGLTPPNPPGGPEGDRNLKFFHAASAEVFGDATESPQSESTPFHPRSPYGEAKVVGFELTKQARARDGIFAVSGILFNHESPRRGEKFVTRKITRGAAMIKLGQAKSLELGDLDARRDWGYAPEYVDAMHRMLHAESPEDFVLATGRTHSVREFCDIAFSELGLDYRDYVRVNSEFVRPPEAMQLVGNSAEAKRLLGWEAQLPFAELVKRMVNHDLALLRDSSLRSPS
ncbi:MAG: GDP-mannose 4,6-dehydratase [Calditrichaeota bacterium]|nr:GDP-mannose 4,6-dehydratase [Calditrichota bacterium]